MQTQIIHMPGRFVKPRDPREQDVCTSADVDAAKAAHDAERIANGLEPDANLYALPQLGHETPIHARIDRAVEDICVGCNLPTRLHRTLDGKTWIGCKGALAKQQPPKNPERWNDPYPAVTCEVRKAMLTACGPDLEIHCSSYTHDELLAVAHTLAKAAIAAYLRELGK